MSNFLSHNDQKVVPKTGGGLGAWMLLQWDVTGFSFSFMETLNLVRVNFISWLFYASRKYSIFIGRHLPPKRIEPTHSDRSFVPISGSFLTVTTALGLDSGCKFYLRCYSTLCENLIKLQISLLWQRKILYNVFAKDGHTFLQRLPDFDFFGTMIMREINL